uniref:F-box domain-containing protein n=1 Tax=Meloidogyne hapla TaxID=6305 RepID=A0A1I8B5E2_MELHA
MNLLPAETNLDIIKCLNFNQLNNIQQSNRHFCALINKYKNELAIKVCDSIELVVYKNYVCKQVEQEPGALEFNLSEELKLKWKAAIKEKTPMYFYDYNYLRHVKFEDEIEKYKMNEIANLFLISEETYGTAPKILRLQIQRYPETIEEMLIYRYWLERLSHCFFENITAEHTVLNARMIDLLFDGSPPLKFQTKYFHFYRDDFFNSHNKYEYMYHHVVVHGSKGIYYEDHRYKLRGEMKKDEERFYQPPDVGEGIEQPVFCRVVDYEFFGVDKPERHLMMYLCFRIGSKKFMSSEHDWINLVL